MKNTFVLMTIIIAGLLVLYPSLSFANCGSCGAHKHTSKSHHAGGKMVCGCPATDASIKKHASMDIVDIAEHTGNFNTLIKAVRTAGLEDTFKSEGPYTLFAPTDEAFASLPAGTLEKLLENPEDLRAVLTYHVFEGKRTSEDILKLKQAKTVNGQTAQVKVTGDQIMINDAKVVNSDIQCSNGVIHIIDRVILPKKMTS
jgi:uncharacterized surface protein with fasciclin (FAS1) repeats